jgi:primosomal protein N' (replication factor Y)
MSESQQPLTSYQRDALAGIRSRMHTGAFHTILCHGVTGSGKTRLYLDAIEDTLAAGRGAIVLVPEISLTPQTVRRFRARFGEKVAVLHSQLSAGERFDAWRYLRNGSKTVAVGPRSAVFAPIPNVGLIVVDEEHDTSYKQEDPDPRYNARDVAIVRAQQACIVVLLGSATPSLESMENVRKGKFSYLRLPERVDAKPLPEVQLVDMRKERATGNWSSLSRVLRGALATCLAEGEQVVILQNRRGFSTVVQCSECGVIVECQNCKVSMTFHQPENRLKCHYCGELLKIPQVCPTCKAKALRYTGTGTQKVQEELLRSHPDCALLRMDQDTTRGRNAHHKLLEQFRQRQASVLLGTQMVAKGLDFPNVTLVGVISADIGLDFPDFRAAERTFQLLTQVAGRTGRGDKPGYVIVQTSRPEDPVIQAASRHDVDGFVATELEKRRDLEYPPFGRLVLLQLRGIDNDAVRTNAEALAAFATNRAGDLIEVLGPTEAPIPRIKKHWRWQVLLKGTSSSHLRSVAKTVQRFHEKRRERAVQLSIDVDPITML